MSRKVSIIIPARDETYTVWPGITVLERTVQEIYTKSTGDIEVLVAFDGPPYTRLPDLPNLIPLELPQRGAKINFNIAAEKATGHYLMKLDAHCMLDDGFDEKLQVGMEDNFVVSPRYFDLNPDRWSVKNTHLYCDYYYLPCPSEDRQFYRFRPGCRWYERTRERKLFGNEENMKLHGSCFFMAKSFFWDCIGGLSEDPRFSSWHGEDIEIGLKTWLGPWNGKLMTNKDTWYAHMRSLHRRKWGYEQKEYMDTASAIAKYWMNNEWKAAVQDIPWLVEKFWPVPTWPDERTLWTR
jgi:glycosyltransferase involved in cell wall biosynthesis